MKNIYVFSFILCSFFMLHGMQEESELMERRQEALRRYQIQKANATEKMQCISREKKHPSVTPDWKGMYNQLVDDYKAILQNRLEEYKKADITKTPWNVKELDTIGNVIAKLQRLTTTAIISHIVDGQANTFLHYAVEKDDKKSIDWLTVLNYNRNFHAKNRHGETAFDWSIKKLLPIFSADTREVSKKIFNGLAFHVSIFCRDSEKIDYLKKIIALQLSYVSYGTELSVSPVKLRNFVKRLRLGYSEEEKKEAEEKLAEYYRAAQNKCGCTFTHVFTIQQHPEALFELIKQNRVSFAKDEKGLTPIDYAKMTLHEHVFTQNGKIIDVYPENFQKCMCCLYMLLNYAKSVAAKDAPDIADMPDFGPCCEKHTLPIK